MEQGKAKIVFCNVKKKCLTMLRETKQNKTLPLQNKTDMRYGQRSGLTAISVSSI